MEILAKVGTALSDIKHEGAEKVGGALQRLREQIVPADQTGCRSRQARAGETSGDLKELGELALEYHWDEIRNATDDFSEARRLGAGASGTVYRGTLEEGTDVAVKVIEGLVAGGFEEEVRLLSKCRHPNVVMLLGFAREAAGAVIPPTTDSGNSPQRAAVSFTARSHRRALVYELLAGGDVEERLRGNKGSCFLWRERLRTAIDMARGLTHLHKHRPEIFHRDIKPPNVLFGSDGAARIADFGLACISKRHAVRELAVEVTAGTPGYADPLYAQTGVVTEASEVYSMGMVLMQLLTRRPPALLGADGSCWFLLSEISPEESGAKNRLLHRIDTEARWPTTVATTVANLALLCIHQDVDQRPSFMDLAVVLQDLIEVDAANANAHAATEAVSGQGRSIPIAVANMGAHLVRGASFAQDASFVQAAPAGMLQAGQPAVRQVAVMRSASSFADGAGHGALPSASSFADGAVHGAVHDTVRPLYDSRIVRGASFADGSFVRGPEGSVVHMSARASHPCPRGHAVAGYAGCSNLPHASWTPRCSEVYMAPQQVLPFQHGGVTYVQR